MENCSSRTLVPIHISLTFHHIEFDIFPIYWYA